MNVSVCVNLLDSTSIIFKTLFLQTHIYDNSVDFFILGIYGFRNVGLLENVVMLYKNSKSVSQTKNRNVYICLQLYNTENTFSGLLQWCRKLRKMLKSVSVEMWIFEYECTRTVTNVQSH